MSSTSAISTPSTGVSSSAAPTTSIAASSATSSTSSVISSAASSSAKSTATNFGTCQASIPSTCKAVSTSKGQSTYLINKPTATYTSSSSTASSTAGLTNASLGQHNGLSTGAKAGVGVGVAIGVLALLGLLAFIVFFMRKRRAAGASQTEKALEENSSEPVLAVGPPYEKQQISENVKELDA